MFCVLRAGVSEWLHIWRRNGWLTYEGDAVENREELKHFDHALRSSRIKVEWVTVPLTHTSSDPHMVTAFSGFFNASV